MQICFNGLKPRYADRPTVIRVYRVVQATGERRPIMQHVVSSGSDFSWDALNALHEIQLGDDTITIEVTQPPLT